MIDEIQKLLNKPYVVEGKQKRKCVCWHFCTEVYTLLGRPKLQAFFRARGLTRLAEPTLYCIVLFNMAGDWHAGVVYPDILHFIHAAPLDIHNRDTTEYVACKERLTAWPYNLLIEGYYEP